MSKNKYSTKRTPYGPDLEMVSNLSTVSAMGGGSLPSQISSKPRPSVRTSILSSITSGSDNAGKKRHHFKDFFPPQDLFFAR